MESLLRSTTSREVYGYLKDWSNDEGEGEGGETNQTVIYITEEGRKYESCEENVRRSRYIPMEMFDNLFYLDSVL